MARIDGVSDKQAGFIRRAIFLGARKQTGKVPEPLRIMALNTGVLWAGGGFELGMMRAKSVDSRLKSLASMKVASMVGCVF